MWNRNLCLILAAMLLLIAAGVSESTAAEGQEAERVERLKLPPGFAAERVYAVPREAQGSWVALCRGPEGTLFASDQGAAGIYQISPAKLGDSPAVTTVTKVEVPVSSAQGLCYHRGVLYANVNGKGSGVWAIRDGDGDGTLDTAEHILPLRGAGEHGPHAVFPTPEGDKLIVMGGNYTRPAALQGSRLPTNWKEDLLLPRQWDTHGHAKGLLAPGGWIAQMNPDGSDFEMLSMGYRNPYDSAFSPEGELFAYDADMEWDMGAPWYRPTRICHATSGSEFGWRAGTGKWPTYSEDSLPPVFDIGPGSPVGVLFGTGGKFPARFQRALYALDWTFGTIHAVHLTPRGASYSGRAEEFVSGTPLPVTDAAIGADGAFYFTTGGRGIESALWRVFYQGEEETAPPPLQPLTHAAEQRRALEKFHGRVDPRAVAAAWPALGSDDRFVRYAARVAIENQPVAEWQDRALGETEPRRALLALMALCRQADRAAQSQVFDALLRIDFKQLSIQQKLTLLRNIGLCFMRLGPPTAAQRTRAIAMLDANFPEDDERVNVELARLLVYLDAPGVISKVLALMETADPPQVPEWGELIARNQEYGSPIAKMLENYPPLLEIQYALLLRNLRYGWTTAERRRYFQWFLDVAKHPGGHSFAGFLKNIRTAALGNCSPAELLAVADLTGQEVEPPPTLEVTPPSGPGREWTVAAATAAVETGLADRNFEQGRNLFHAAQCAACHRFDGSGGTIGPDLSSVSARLSRKDLLENIIEPSRVISDQYGSHLVSTRDGKERHGRVVPGGAEDPPDSIRLHTQDLTAEPILIRREEIEAMDPSPISQMPLGLLKPLSEAELLDLVAYLLSRGNREDPMFATPAASDPEEGDPEEGDPAEGGRGEVDSGPASEPSAAKQVPQPAAERLASRRFRFEYTGSVEAIPAGETVRLWLPVPVISPAQEVRIVDVDLPGPYTIGGEAKYGNRMFSLETVAPKAGEIPFRVRYEILRRELRAAAGGSENKIDPQTEQSFLLPNRMVPVGEQPAVLATDWPRPEDALARARAIYEGVLQHMRYDKSRPGYGRGDARWACRSGFGNCTDFHSLFIAIARDRAIPAKFEIGFPLPSGADEGEIAGYHCWASFYVDGRGWIPVDISEADKHPELRQYYFGNLTANRVAFSTGRDLILAPPQAGEPLNYFVYPYAEVAGKAWPQDKIKTRFEFSDLPAREARSE